MTTQTLQKWNKVKLGQVLTLNYGKGLPARDRVDGEYPVYGSAGIVGSHNSFVAKGPGIVVGRKGSIGEIYLSKRNYYPIDTAYYINSSDKYDIFFIYYLLKTLLLKTLNTDAAVPGLNRNVAYQQEFLLPNLPTQKQIASILSIYDDLIENNTRQIQILEQMAQAVYTEWFVNFRFPGHEKVKMADSGTDFGKIPEKWEVMKLGNRINISRGKNITQNTVEEGNIPVVAGGLEPAYYHSTANTEAPVVTVSASGANAGFVNLYMENIWASDCSYIDRKSTPYIFYYYLLLNTRQAEVTGMQRGSAQPHVYPKDLAELLVVNAPENLLKQFEEKINPIFKMIGNLKHRNKVLRESRDLLLPKLVTGKINV